jgi:hypothetical protein
MHDRDLLKVIQAWDKLSAPVKAGVLAMISAASAVADSARGAVSDDLNANQTKGRCRSKMRQSGRKLS